VINYKTCSVLIVAIVAVFESTAYAQEDERNFEIGSSPEVRINWNSFVAWGIPDEWRDAVVDCVIGGYTRWEQVAGANVRPKFQGFTTRMEAVSGEILVIMNEAHINPRYGTTIASWKHATIIFHRKSSPGGTLHNWVPYWAMADEVDFQAVFNHEFGHALGLRHNTGLRDAMYGGYEWTRMRFGPSTTDRADLVALYGVHNTDRFFAKRSIDNGSTWSTLSTNLVSLGISTTNDPGALRDGSNLVIAYSAPTKSLCFVSSDDSTEYGLYPGGCFGGVSSFYGVSIHGFDGKYMIAYVDNTDDDMKVKVIYSPDGGNQWYYRNPPQPSMSIGTPSIWGAGEGMWLLAYAKLDRADRTNTGKIAIRVSENDGASWGDEQILTSTYLADSGVSIAEQQTVVRVGFMWAVRTTASNDPIRTIRANRYGDYLEYVGMMYGSVGTRTRPDLDVNSLSFHSARRGTDFNTSGFSRIAAFGDTAWSDIEALISSDLSTTPALAADARYPWIYVYGVSDP